MTNRLEGTAGRRRRGNHERIGRSSGVVAILTLALACGSESSSGDGGPVTEASCEPGTEYTCPCADGSMAVQVCNETGTGLGPCSCTTASGTGGVTGTGAVPAAGGLSATGGTTTTGGAGNTGGVINAGGVGNTGGTVGVGGQNVGGTSAGGANAGGAGPGGADPGGAGGVGGQGTGGAPPAGGPALPIATAACPAFIDGTMSFTVGGTARSARIWVDLGATATLDGPVLFYWYGTGGQPSQATSAVGTDGINRITAAGGVVVAPTHINSGTFPWIGGGDVDFLLMDEIVACAEEQLGIDETHVHSLGFSAGALFTTQVSYSRSAYVASVATYSGGGTGISQDPSNLFAAMILYGGSGDQLVANFADTSQQYYDDLTSKGHFALLCNHGGGHSIPTNARSSVIDFFFDHGFKEPSPYASGLPAGFINYCQ